MANKFKTLLHHLISPLRSTYFSIYHYIKGSRLAKILIVIVIIKMLIFHRLFQEYYYRK